MLSPSTHSKNIHKERESNFELLRIVAMFLVLMLHANFISIGSPTISDCHEAPFNSILRYFFQSLSIGCVDIFVLISGWFGIRPSIKSFTSFIFQCFFFLFGVYAVCCIGGISEFNFGGLKACLLFIPD